jgi:hypothetical protein
MCAGQLYSTMVTFVVQKVEMCNGQLYSLIITCVVQKVETCDGQLYGCHLCDSES